MARNNWTPDQLIELYNDAGERGDTNLQRIVGDLVDQMRRSERVEDGIRIASFVVAAVIAVGFLVFAAILVINDNVLLGAGFAVADVIPFVKLFIDSRSGNPQSGGSDGGPAVEGSS